MLSIWKVTNAIQIGRDLASDEKLSLLLPSRQGYPSLFGDNDLDA